MQVPLIKTNEQARAWFTDVLSVSRETMDKLDQFEAMLLVEMDQQNLVAASTVESLWARHFADSAQLMLHLDAVDKAGAWIDLGAGAGLPGIIIAILDSERPIHLVESRVLRCMFLEKVARALGLDNVTVHHSRLELVPDFEASVISARAFAPLDKLLKLAHRFSTEKTRWLLPKGKNAVNELEMASKAWQRLFHVEQSITDADSRLLIGTGSADVDAAAPAPAKSRNRKYAARKYGAKKNVKAG